MERKQIKSEWLLTFDKRHSSTAAMTSAVKVLNKNKFFGGFIDVVDEPDGDYKIRLRTTTYHEVTEEEERGKFDQLLQDIYRDLEEYKDSKKLM